MSNFIFDLQRFADVTISAGETYALDGVTYTALTDAQLNLDSDNKISGIASGKVTAVVTGAENSPTAAFDATDGEFNFTASGVDGAFVITGNGLGYMLSGGSVTMSADEFEGNAGVQKLSFTKDSSISIGKDGKAINVVAKEDSTFHTWLTDKSIIYCKLDGDSADFDVSLAFNGEKIIGNTLTFGGRISYSPAQGTIALINDGKNPDTKDSFASFNLGNYKFQMATDGKTVVAGLKVADDGTISINYPLEDYNKTHLTVSRGDTPIFDGNLTVSDGSIGFNPVTKAISLSDGTKISTAFGDYEVTATAAGDAAVSVTMTSAGLSITPVKGDGTLNLKLSSEIGSMSANLEVLSGSFILGENGTLTVTKDTELQIDFGGGYIVKFKTTDDAGGKISLGAGGLTFTPNIDDGHLELTITKGDETRSATLDVTGTVTYNLDGSISLAQGTVVKNHFNSGANLTITAKTDSDGSIIFNPSSGLTITNNLLGALKATLEHDTIFVFDDIIGSITYNSGKVTVHDGTTAVSWFEASDYQSAKGTCSSTGGDTMIDFASPMQVYSVAEGATYKVEEAEEFWELSRGNLCGTFYEGETVYLLTEGSVVNANESIKFLLESAGNYTLNGMKVTTTTDNAKVVLTDYDTIIVDGISYTPLDENVTLTIGENGATVAGGKVTMQMEGFDIALSEDVTDGSISYNSTTNKFTVKAGTKSYLGEGKFPDQFVAKNDFDISVTKTDDGKFKFSLGDESIAFDLTRNGKAIMGSTITLDGSIIVDPTNNEISLPKDTVITMTPGTGKTLKITALDDAGGELTLANGGLRFKPNENDGALEFNFVDAERKATLDVTGAFTYKGLGALSLEDGTVANLTWTDGTELKITSSGSTGSIGIDPDKGIKITSDDENLDMTLTTPYMSTDISGIKGTIYYKEGNVSFDENSKIIATTTLGGQPILTTLETIDGTGHISFSGTTNGIVYSADTGAMKITWSNDDDLESTFVVNKGSIQIGHNLFRIAEGSDIATDLKTFVPALYFTTAEAGTYTINGQKITTSAEGLALTATDDQMVFKTSGDVVEYNGMTFTGNGNVSLKADNVVLGEGVEATGFSEDKSFVLAEAGNVTADAKVFELSKIEGTPREIPMIITVTGAQDGFVFSRTLTKESEAYLDDALDDEKFGNYSSSYIGKVFTEKFIAAGDSSYRIRTDAIGLEEVIGISDGATITGGASLADEPTLSYYNLVTDTTGKFTIGERTYNVSGDSSIALRARFEENAAPYASMVDSLNGTISGDFSGGNFSINGSSALKIINDTDISIVADENGYEILGLDAGAKLQVSAADTYKVNGTEITAGASSVIVGTADGKAQLYNLPATLADFMLHKTAAGYPQMAALAFHPDEENPDAPTNYHSAEKWTTASADDLQLSAIHYSPENPTGKWVILVHGYGKKGAAMNAFAEPYLAQGLDVLIVDQRTAGDSEGDWLTMGVAEANDLAIWTQEIAKTNANAQITLHGVSMGAATVMLCAALPETENVSAIIEDCGYGNIADVFATLLTYYGSSLGVGDVDYYELFDEVAAVAETLNGGYDVGDAAPIESIGAVIVPSLFIHGAADGVIPSTNADALYEASGAENKTKLIIEGAGHAQSIELDTEAYLAAVKKLIDSSTEEIGAWIDSDANNKLLRGTIYDDTITNSGTAVTIEALGGDDGIINNVDSSLVAAELGNFIDAGDGNDTIYSYHTYNPTLLGGAGDDSIVVERGHKTFADGGKGNDTIIGVSEVGGWGMGDYATVLGGAGNDYINPIYSANASIDGGKGDDTILANGASATIDGGTGNNLIVLTDDEGGVKGKFVVLNGNTTVESFNTGFETDLDPEMGEGTDTVYIKGESPAVDFKADGLTLYYDDDKTKSLTFSDINKTEKLNLYYEQSLKSVAEVFIADDEWYSVTENDLSVRDDSELWFVGATAKMNHGIDFGGISDALNITLNTDYEADVDSFRINNIHSIKGGAGLTTITGSDKDDTIIAGTGKTTIDGGDGKNLIDLNDSSAAQIVLNGQTTVEGFQTGFGEGTDTVYIKGESPAVDFKADGLTLYYDDDKTKSLTFSDINKTEKLNLYYEQSLKSVAEVFIADDEWYSVTENDLSVRDDSELWFVGATAKMNHGIDFGGISDALNITLNTDYEADVDSFRINNIHSIKGGAGLTTITGSDKDDTIIAGTGSTTIDAGAGNNLINLEDAESALIQLAGNTTVKGFQTGFGEGTDTIYIDGDPAGVEFKDGVLAFGNSTDSLTMSDITTTAKVNIYHKRREVLNKGVFIAAGDWYKVEDSDLTVNAGEEVYFVGTSADPEAGVDFSGISSALNVTIDTAYIDSEDYVPGTTMWVNGAHSLKGGAGNTTITGSNLSDTIFAGAGKTTINAGAGDDTVDLTGSSGNNLIKYAAGDGNDVITGFNKNSTLNVSGNDYSTAKSGNDLILTVGDDSITLEDAATLNNPNIIGTKKMSTEDIIKEFAPNHSSVVSAEDTGKKDISLTGGDLAVVEKTDAKVSIVASKSTDTIFSEGENVTVSLTGGATNLIAAGGKMTVENYNATTGAAFVTSYDDIFEAVDKGKLYFNKGKLSIDSAAIVDFNGMNSGVINFYDASGELQKVAQAASDESLDLSKETDDLILAADTYSTLISGKGNDSLFAFSGSKVDAGAGKNYIEIETTNDDSVTISLSGGKTTIANFKAGFDDTSDRLFFGVKDTVDFKFDGTDLKVYNNGELRGIVSNIADNAPFVNILTEDDNAPVKVVVAQKDAVITVDDELADLYIGNKSGVDFTNYESDLMVNLGSTEDSVGTGEVLFSGINQITVGGGMNTLIGSSANETLTGNDNGTTEFVFGKGNGRDVIKNFNFTEDKISVGDETITAVVLKENNVRMQIDGDGWITLEDAKGKNFKINDFVAKVDENIEYDDAANFYVATAKNAKVTVADEAEIWLDGSHGKTFVGDVKTLDATKSDGKNTLAGNDLDNTISAGVGDASLWGGNGGDDLLVGGASKNMFFYAYGNGNDTIKNANSGDTVYLAGITIDQIASTEIAQGTVAINFKDGGKLNVESSNAVEFALEGATYLADHSTGTWQQK